MAPSCSLFFFEKKNKEHGATIIVCRRFPYKLAAVHGLGRKAGFKSVPVGSAIKETQYLGKIAARTCRSTLQQFLDYAFCVYMHAAIGSAGWVSHATLTVSKVIKGKNKRK